MIRVINLQPSKPKGTGSQNDESEAADTSRNVASSFKAGAKGASSDSNSGTDEEKRDQLFELPDIKQLQTRHKKAAIFVADKKSPVA